MAPALNNRCLTRAVMGASLDAALADCNEALKLVPPTTLSLEQSMEFLADDELLEVTPKSIRLRKMILDKSLRLKAESRRK